MSAPPELILLRSIKTGKGLIKLIDALKEKRRVNKVQGRKRAALPVQQRRDILAKTDGHCHICGITLDDQWQADHVKPHSVGGAHKENNYLPSCPVCNNYRWHYSPEEIQLILKLGVWLKTKITYDPALGPELAGSFIKHELALRKRRMKNNH